MISKYHDWFMLFLLWVFGGVLLGRFNYRIKKIMNNNIILAFDLNKRSEKIIIGRGIGFGKEEGKKAFIPDESIEKAFTADDKKMRREYFRLVEKVDDMIIAVCEKVICEAEKELGSLNSHIHILLTDHICFAIERVKSGLTITNPFDEEIQVLYPKEYELAIEAINKIRRFIGVNLGQGEVGFIAMHLHSARKNVNVKETLKNTRVMKEIVGIIEDELNIKLNKTEYQYKRLINHIQGTINRIQKGKNVENPLLMNLKEKFKDSFTIVEKVKEKIENEYEINVSEEELGYLAIHIERLKM